MPRRKTPKLSEEEKTPELYEQDPTRAKALAKIDYMAYGSIRYCSDKYGIPLATLRNWVYSHRPGRDSWKDEKERENQDIMKNILKSADVKKNIKAINNVGLAIVRRVLEETYADEKEISMGEAQKLMDILSKSDTMLRLAEGEATTIVAKVDTTPEGVKKLVEEFAEVDPYGDYELAEDEKDLIQ